MKAVEIARARVVIGFEVTKGIMLRVDTFMVSHSNM